MTTLSLEQQVIRDIRRMNGVEDDLLRRALQDPDLGATIDHLKGGYARALVILSDDLYTKPAHCVLEMVQNAVDNPYAEGVSPTLEIELRQTDLQVWCNEVGFSEANVKAFCSIGSSTKKNKKGYIGEKGIGAKSMFKVATKVTVQSRDYSFMLDRDKELGMISPIWVDRAVPAGREEWTGMNLDFGSNKPFDDLKAQLLKIRDYILIFLPKLSSLSVNIDGAHFSVQRTEAGTRVTLKTVTGDRSTTKDFLRFAKTIKMSVSDPKREGQEETDVVLAFPLQQDGQPDLSMQPDVYAFLPLRRVGFKFVVQADLLTAANREDVLTGSHWNMAIRDSLPAVFLGAVETLRATPSLELTWPRFIPCTSDISDPFFKQGAEKILTLLKSAAIIRCSDDVYRSSSQVYIAGDFKDANGRPFIEHEHVGLPYVSSEYPSDVVKIFKSRLGVAEMSLPDFTNGLVGMKDRGKFKHWDNAWLEGVCDILARSGFDWSYISGKRSYIQDRRIRLLPLIQLSTGSWVSCESCDKYFFDSSGFSFPSGLKIQVIGGPSPQSSNRCSLLRKLGVCDLDVAEVIKQIIALHTAERPTLEVTLEQIIYLYNHRSLIKASVWHIHLYDQHGKPHYGSSLYMDDPQDSDPDRVHALLGDSALFVHEEILNPPSLSQEFACSATALTQWQLWLTTAFGVRTKPCVSSGRPVADFVAGINRHRLNDSPRLLRLLKKYWPAILDQTSYSERKSLCTYFGGLNVCCKGGQVVPLSATFFPSSQILQYDCNGLPLLDLGDYSPDWSFLVTLGVSTKPDGRFFLKQLVALSQTSGEKVQPSAAMTLYEQINLFFAEFPEEAIAAFSKHALILFNGHWYNSQSVFWKGPSYLTVIPALKKKYPYLKVFFQDRLNIKDAPPDIIANELRHFSKLNDEVMPNSSEHLHLLELLRHAAKSVDSIRKGKLADWTPTVSGCSLFPVKSPSNNQYLSDPDVPLKLMTSTDLFFVHDTNRQLYTLFCGVTPFLALGDQQLFEFASFLEHVGVLPGKRVDVCVSQTVEIDDQPITIASSRNGTRNYDLSQYFNAKLPYLARYLYYQRNKMRLHFTEFCVYNVSSIKTACALSKLEHTQNAWHESWVNPRDNIIDIFLVDNAAAATTEASNLSVAKGIADVLDIDLGFMVAILLSADDKACESMLKLMKIGALELPVESLELIAEDPDELHRANSVAPVSIDPQTHTINRRREELKRLSVVAWGNRIPSATRFKEPVLALGETDLIKLDPESTVLPRPTTTTDLILANRPLSPSGVDCGDQQICVGASDLVKFSGKPEQQLTLYQNPASIACNSSVGVGVKLIHSRAAQIDLLGEQYVFELLKSTLRDFSADNWTSKLREFADLPSFSGDSHADFQYYDHTGELTRQLLPHDAQVHRERVNPMIYIKVKATSGRTGETFHMTPRQFRRAAEVWRGRNPDSTPSELYVLFRVSNLGNGGEPVLKAYVDIHDLLARGNMRIESSLVEVRICGEEV